MPRNGGDTMSWFEQGTSSARCIITQLHRPAELKLKRMYTRHLAPVCSPDIRELLLFKRRRRQQWNTVHATGFFQNDGDPASAGACARSGFSAFAGHRFWGFLKAVAFFCPFLGKQRPAGDEIDTFFTSEVKGMDTGSSNSATTLERRGEPPRRAGLCRPFLSL